MQDLTGVPAVVDLASMRDAIIALGGDPNKINPLVPVELVIDHSVILERFRHRRELRTERRDRIRTQRRALHVLEVGSEFFEKFRVVPPGMGICHQVNLEHPRARRLRTRRRRLPRHIGRHCSHTTW